MFASSNVIQVGVRKQDGFDAVAVVVQIFGIWYHVVNARIITIRKQSAHINQDNFIFILNGSHVFANAELAQATNRNDSHGVRMWAGGANLPHRHLVAMVAVVTRFIYWNTNNVLRSLCVHILAKHALMMDHLAFACRD